MNIPLKTKVKYWYYFLRLCHLSNDPVVQRNLKKSKLFYEPWDNYLTGSYEDWWKSHSHLFRNKSVLSKLTSSEQLESNHLYIKIPLTYSPSSVSKLVKSIYTEEQNKTLKKDGKVKKSYNGTFQLTTTDLQTSQFDYYLRFTRDVYVPLMNQDVTGTKKYRELSEEVFKKQKLKSSRKKDEIKRQVPFTGSSQEKENLDRLTRRYKTISRLVLLNVSKGEFPGVYEEHGTKTQIETRREVKVRGKLRGVNQKKYQEVIRRKNELDPYRDLIPKRTY